MTKLNINFEEKKSTVVKHKSGNHYLDNVTDEVYVLCSTGTNKVRLFSLHGFPYISVDANVEDSDDITDEEFDRLITENDYLDFTLVREMNVEVKV